MRNDESSFGLGIVVWLMSENHVEKGCVLSGLCRILRFRIVIANWCKLLAGKRMACCQHVEILLMAIDIVPRQLN